MSVPEAAIIPPDISSLSELIDELGRSGHGLVMVMGKGGVGKTTVAAAVAVALAKRGLPVHLTTMVPAQHIRETLQSEVARLRVSYIDPKQEVRQYRARTLEAARPTLSAEKVALLEEELKSPCYEEVAVFQAFSRAVIGARKEIVVIDTAPTGHTLLLLDTAGAYHRQLTQQAAGGPARIRTALMFLQVRNIPRCSSSPCQRRRQSLRRARSRTICGGHKSSRSHGSSMAVLPPPIRGTRCCEPVRPSRFRRYARSGRRWRSGLR